MFMKRKILYAVIAVPFDRDKDAVICSICDNLELANSFCNDVLSKSVYFGRVYVSKYNLNCLKAW